MYEKLNSKVHEIGVRLINFFNTKKDVGIFCISKDYQDNFLPLCCLHTQQVLGNVFLDDKHMFFSDSTVIEDIIDKYDSILIIDCIRFSNDYDVELNFIDNKTIKLTYYTKDTLTYENLNKLIFNYTI